VRGKSEISLALSSPRSPRLNYSLLSLLTPQSSNETIDNDAKLPQPAPIQSINLASMSSSQAAIARLQAVMDIAAGGNNNGNVAAAASAPPSSIASANTPPGAPIAVNGNVLLQPIQFSDDANDGGYAIDTFSSYVPSALPHCVLKALFGAHHPAKKSTHGTQDNGSKSEIHSKQQNDVIEILDDTDDECEQSSTKQEAPASTLTNSDYSSLLFTKNGLIQSHTSPACESALLSSVSACNFSSDCGDGALNDEAASTILPLIVEGKLSPLQAEGVTMAITRFNRVFTSKEKSHQNSAVQRAGFFLGDGAGIGKGRQISATIRDSFCRNHGRGRHLWISTSRELVEDAKRDLRDVGCHIEVHDGVDLLGKTGGLGVGGSLGKGVLFITYSLLGKLIFSPRNTFCISLLVTNKLLYSVCSQWEEA